MNQMKNAENAQSIPALERSDPLIEAIRAFLADQEQAIYCKVSKIVSDAAPRADLDGEKIYTEISYDDLPDPSGVDLSLEILLGFVDIHSAVDHTDIHNTGVTIYFQDLEILRGLGLNPESGSEAGQKIS
ncbi:hypothetical protein [Anaerotruncus rubiinfantis]|uniref:hypothetical protein n=1 Tax=Anaerotruncus rubiinfantis TaxID=1720200 RepID=UPI000837A890|nr:hypothetical protein [Anaerotruncus rubiinfantis]